MVEKIKILFVGRSVDVGGIQRALVDQVNSLSKDIYDVSLFLFSTKGVFFKEISTDVNIIKPSWILNSICVSRQESKCNIITFVFRNFFALLTSIFGSKRIFSFLFKFVPSLGPYDIAISYFHDQNLKSIYYGTNDFVLKKVNAKKKIAWIHSDYVGTALNCDSRDKVYRKFDAVVNVSFAMKKKCDDYGLVQADRSFIVYNRINDLAILKKSLTSTDLYCNGKFLICTVCRFDKNKGVIQLCDVAKELKDSGCDFLWVFIGCGPLMDNCKRFVNENGLNDYVVFLGQKSNPYPYIKQSDLYVSGSKTETFGISVYEALLLGVPVVAYRYDAINEVLSQTNGKIVNDFNEMVYCLKGLIEYPQSIAELKKACNPIKDYNQENNKQFQTMINKLFQ